MMHAMKGFLFALAGAVLLAGGAFSADGAESGPPISGQMRNFEALDDPAVVPAPAMRAPDGGPASLEDLRGRLRVGPVWATWGAPCGQNGRASVRERVGA